MKKIQLLLIFTICFSQLAIAKHTYKIGVVCPLTNSSKTFGIGHLQGITLAVKEFNKVNPKLSIGIDIRDDHSSPAQAINEILELYRSDIIAVMGPCNSAVAKHIIDDKVLAIPIVSSLTTNSKLIMNSDNKYFFRANVPDSQRMDALLDKIFSSSIDSPNKLTVFFEENDAYGEGLKQDVTNWFQKNEKKYLKHYVSFSGYSRDASSSEIRLLIDDEKSRGFLSSTHAALMLGIASDAKNIIKEIRQNDLSAQLYFSEPNHTVFQSLASEGVNMGGLRVLSVWDPDNRYIDSFKAVFIDEFAEEPVFAASLAYDATNILLWAFKKAVEENDASIQVIRDAIRSNLSIFDSSTGVDTILSGNLSLSSHEYEKLRFAGLQYYSDGSIGGWDDEEKVLTVSITKQRLSLELPNLIHVLVLVLFGCLGGALREYQYRKNRGLPRALNVFLRAEVMIDGLISLVTASFLLIVVLVTEPTFLTSGADVSTVYYFSAVAIGVLSGFLGIRSIYALLKRFDIEFADKHNKATQPTPK